MSYSFSRQLVLPAKEFYSHLQILAPVPDFSGQSILKNGQLLVVQDAS